MKEFLIDKTKLTKEELQLLDKIKKANIQTNFITLKIEINNQLVGKKTFVLDDVKKESIDKQTIDKILSDNCRQMKLELIKFVNSTTTIQSNEKEGK
jgi:hypothetical protein